MMHTAHSMTKAPHTILSLLYNVGHPLIVDAKVGASSVLQTMM